MPANAFDGNYVVSQSLHGCINGSITLGGSQEFSTQFGFLNGACPHQPQIKIFFRKNIFKKRVKIVLSLVFLVIETRGIEKV